MKLPSSILPKLAICFLLITSGFSGLFAQAPGNDDCLNASQVFSGVTVSGTTVGSTTDGLSFCGPSITSPGVWYLFNASTTTTRFSTCSAANFDTKISVFSGGCSALVCEGGNDDGPGCSGNTSDFVLPTTPGGDYLVLVTGFSNQTGNFDLTVTSINAPQNSACSAATPINCGDVVNGTTFGAPPQSVPNCKNVLNSGPGVWYILQGNGDNVTLSTCDSLGFDTKISVYTGSCGNFACLAANDDDVNCGISTTRSTTSFASIAGQTYYVLVHGFGTSAGNFRLSVNCSPPVQPAPNDVCTAAIPIACGQTIAGSTVNASPDTVPFCFTDNGSNGVWYSFTGTGGTVLLSTCNPGTNYDTRIRVFENSCGNLTCVAGDDDDPFCSFSGLRSTVRFTSDQGKQYLALVHGFELFGNASNGDFELTLDCPTGPPNDNACNATTVSFGTTIFSNRFASRQPGEVNPGPGTGSNTCNSGNGWCSFAARVDNSVWFKFTAPTSGCVTVVANGFDSQLAIWEVTDCNDFNSFVEVYANDDGGKDVDTTFSRLSAAIIEGACLTPGATYYLQVDGFDLNQELDSAQLVLQDCGNGPLSVDAGGCQSLFFAQGLALNDTSFLIAAASGGFPPYTPEWRNGGLYQNGPGYAVQPNQTKTYFAKITDSKGCVAEDSVTVFVQDITCISNGDTGVTVCYQPPVNCPNVLTFLTNANGDTLPAGTPIDSQWVDFGVTVSAINNHSHSSHPDIATIFDSNNPTGGDWDLGTPNQAFGGPGIGSGGGIGRTGANSVSYGNLLIIAENDRDQNSDGLIDDPDDEARGGSIEFTFASPATVNYIQLVDCDDGTGGSVITCTYGNGTTATYSIPNLGDNSVHRLNINVSNLAAIKVNFSGSGAIGEISYCLDAQTLCVPVAQLPTYLADSNFRLGPCSNTCVDKNERIPAPVSCVDLVVSLTTDFLGTETSWALWDVKKNKLIDTALTGSLPGGVTLLDTFCVDPRGCYEFRIWDSFGDGICCSPFFGNGNYTISLNGLSISSPSGGQFGRTESVRIGDCQGAGNKQSAEAPAPERGVFQVSAYPNPFQDVAYIKFRIPTTETVLLEVYDIRGHKVATLFDEVAEGGSVYTVELDGAQLSSGLYLYNLRTSSGRHDHGKLYLAR